MQSLSSIEGLLKSRLGLDPEVLGRNVLAGAVDDRIKTTSSQSIEVYAGALATSAAELEALAGKLLVHETWFFRDRVPFDYLSRFVRTSSTRFAGRKLRILSAPCATGEEAYSIAVILLETGLSPESFEIDALDLNREALNKAEAAVYSENSFRFTADSFKTCYFHQVDGTHALMPSVRSLVNLEQGNLLDPTWAAGKGVYDIVFCRNLLIYLDERSRNSVLRNVEAVLQPDGLLFVGAAEAGQMPAERFVPVRHPKSFAFLRKTAAGLAKTTTTVKVPSPRRMDIHEPPRRPTPPLARDTRSAVSEPRSESPVPVLNRARLLADRGDLAEASKLCGEHLEENRDDAEGHVLLGLIRVAAGEDRQAEDCFARAVYLEPDHREALIHLALLVERRRDDHRAQVLKRRLDRVS